ncbi:MAG: metallophosphoesterase family protein [Myxococcales bacterium]|nr:metallophosphoesterase family protein [Myxococcales bacterium]MCB9579174.1 metallophosphoesterase family protein [Polyangiaceae bacterium]
MYRSIYWILAASALVAAAGCGEDTGKAAKKTPTNTTLELPYTPEGCDYTVSAPEGIEEVGGDEDVVGAEPTPKHIHASWAGSPETTFAINWATDLDTKRTEILYGSDKAAVEAADGAGNGVTLQTGHTMQFGSPIFQDQKLRVHETHVCGLTEDTTYYYKVGGPGHWSSTYDIATAPKKGSSDVFRFAVTGDSRSGPEVFAQIQEKLSTMGVDFQIFSGDFIDNTTNQQHWDALFESSTGSYSTQDMIATRPLMPVNGNHDNLSVYYVGQFAVPQKVSQGETAQGEEWYSFDYANAHFLMLDSEGNSKLKAQVDFIKADLEAVDRNVTPWVFAVFHTPPYTCGSTHQGDSDAPRATWQPLFDQYKVDVVLTGHVHNYQRTLPIRGFKTGSTDGQVANSGAGGIPVGGSGTIYVVSAGAGGDLYNADPASACDTAYLTEKTNNFLVLEVEGGTLRYKALRLDGSEIDAFEYTR